MYEKLKKELQEIYEEKGRGAIFRSKARWTEDGEKPTKYFFNLEKTRYEKKIISQLKIGEDKFVSHFKQVNKEIENHYILHRVLVANKGLKKFKIRNDDLCDQCKTPDSLEHTFLRCPANVKFYHEILSWFNVSHNTLINISPGQILMQKNIPGPINVNLRRRLDLIILFIIKYVYLEF